jgi:hypothetical protein
VNTHEFLARGAPEGSHGSTLSFWPRRRIDSIPAHGDYGGSCSTARAFFYRYILYLAGIEAHAACAHAHAPNDARAYAQGNARATHVPNFLRNRKNALRGGHIASLSLSVPVSEGRHRTRASKLPFLECTGLLGVINGHSVKCELTGS